MTTVAVTAAASTLGRAVLAALDADSEVERIVGLDLVEPPMPVAKLDFRIADRRDALLSSALRGTDVLVHLPPALGPGRDEDTRFALAVHGTRNLLEAAEKVGVGQLVHLSSATVYGAHPDNPVPMDEAQVLRANPDLATAYHHLLAEELVMDWASNHPGTPVARLRSAPMLAPGHEDLLARYLENPRLPIVAGCSPPLQFVHVDDVATAAAFALRARLDGAYNVAADGWLPMDEVCAVLGRRTIEVPEQVAFSLTESLWRRGLSPLPPGAVRFAMHPCVVSNQRLREAGWTPSRSNREVLREFAAAHHHHVSFGALQVRRRNLYGAGVLGATASAGAALAVGMRARRHLETRKAGG